MGGGVGRALVLALPCGPFQRGKEMLALPSQISDGLWLGPRVRRAVSPAGGHVPARTRCAVQLSFVASLLWLCLDSPLQPGQLLAPL